MNRRALLLSALVAGCGSPPVSPPDMAPVADLATRDLANVAMPDLAQPPDLSRLVSISGHIKDYNTMAALQGVMVCVMGTQKCTSTDAMGFYEFTDFMPGTKLMLTTMLAGYLPDATEIQVPTQDFNGGRLLIKTADAMRLAQAVGENLDPQKPGLIVDVGGTQSTGVAVMMAPSPGGRGPIYLDDNGVPRANQMTTGKSGIAVYINSVPGDYDATLTHANGKCTAGLSWPSNQGTVAVTLLPGYYTVVFPQCN